MKKKVLPALLPASEHLLKAAGELVAAAQIALEAVPSPTRAWHTDAIQSGRAALSLLGSMAKSGATRARTQARAEARREALAEILDALESRSSALHGPAADALDAVRDAVASAAGIPSSRPEPEPGPRPAKTGDGRAGSKPRTGVRRRSTRVSARRSRSEAEPSDERGARREAERPTRVGSIRRELEGTPRDPERRGRS